MLQRINANDAEITVRLVVYVQRNKFIGENGKDIKGYQVEFTAKIGSYSAFYLFVLFLEFCK